MWKSMLQGVVLFGAGLGCHGHVQHDQMSDGGIADWDAVGDPDASNRDGSWSEDGNAGDAGGPADAEVIDPNAKFVSPDGDDANDGSMDHPWKTVRYAVAHLESGQTLYLREGTYHLEGGEVDGTYDPERDVVSPPSGLQGQPTVNRGYPGENAVLDGSHLLMRGSSGEPGNEPWLFAGSALGTVTASWLVCSW